MRREHEHVIHVAKWGMDGHGDGSELQPFATIAGAMRRAPRRAADHVCIHIGPGTYVEEPMYLPKRPKRVRLRWRR